MRLMIFSDIHGNLEALKSVITHASGKNVHRRICLGDIVGYGPQPEECIRLVQSLNKCRVLAGNHDVATLWQTSPYGMSPAAKKVILWTMDQLSPESKEYLTALPDRLDFAEMTFTHANPYNPLGWRYVLDRKQAMRCFAATRNQHLFIGHSHRPVIFTRKTFLSVDIQAVPGSMQIKLDDSRRRIVNCGSVGQPRDKDSRACYIIFDTRTQLLEYYRVEYDVEITAKAVERAGLPFILAKRLHKGI